MTLQFEDEQVLLHNAFEYEGPERPDYLIVYSQRMEAQLREVRRKLSGIDVDHQAQRYGGMPNFRPWKTATIKMTADEITVFNNTCALAIDKAAGALAKNIDESILKSFKTQHESIGDLIKIRRV